MKTTSLLLLFLLAGCVNKTPAPLKPVTHISTPPPMPQLVAHAAERSSLAARRATVVVPVPLPPEPPAWQFTVAGDYRIDASTNLTTWYQIATVYSVTNVTIQSDTVAKIPILFYRLTKL